MRLLTLSGVFRPDGDSRMLAEILAMGTGSDDRVLDVFAGSGVLAITAARAGAADVWAVEVSRRAVFCVALNARLNGVEVSVRRGSMLEPVRGESFDTIVANPPYVPTIDEGVEPRGSSRAWEGGRDGRALLDPFLAQAPRHVRPGGRILVVHSSLSGIDRTLELLGGAGLEAQVAARREVPLGPLASGRVEVLEQRGALRPGQRTETIAVIEGCRAPVESGPPRESAEVERVG